MGKKELRWWAPNSMSLLAFFLMRTSSFSNPFSSWMGWLEQQKQALDHHI